METYRVLVLGATGQVGKALFEGFKSNPEFKVIGSTRGNYMDPLLIQFDPFKDDWKTLGKANVVINCIGQINEVTDFDFSRIHLGVTEKILENRSHIGNPRIIQISALGADKDHEITFLKTKGQADEMLLKEPDTYVVRPSIVCTSGTMLVKKFRMLKKVISYLNRNLIVPKGFLQMRIQPVMIEDLVEAIQKVCLTETGRGLVEFGGSEKISFLELTKILEHSIQNTIKIREWNEGIFRTMVKYVIFPLLPRLINYDQYRLLFSDNVSDSNDLENLLGRKPGSTKNFWRSELK